MTCEKVRYFTRADARKARQQIGGRGLRPYVCPLCIDRTWHLGHLPGTIRRGERSRSDVYDRRARGGEAA